MELMTLVFSAVAALGAVGFGIVAWVYAHRNESRAKEVHDVIWRPRSTEHGFDFTHDGSLTVRNVFITVSVHGDATTGRADSVARGERVSVHSHAFVRHLTAERENEARYQEELREFENRPRGVRTPLGVVQPSFQVPPMRTPSFPVPVSAVIVWTYPSGSPDRQELAWRA